MSKPKKKQIEDYEKELTKLQQKQKPFSNLFNWCLAICAAAAEKNKCLRQQLFEFGEVDTSYWKQLYYFAHPSKRGKGWQWMEGQKTSPAP